MGNLQDALKRNKHLENQNRGLLDALKRKNGQLESYKEDSAKALADISDMMAAYIGAVCLSNEDHTVRLEHADIKRVLGQYDVTIEADENGMVFKLVEKNNE